MAANAINTLGETIRELRRRAGLTQEELAEGICSSVSVSRIECGRQMPSKPVLDALLARLGTGTYQLCDVYYQSEKDEVFARESEAVGTLLAQGDFAGAHERIKELGEFADGRPTHLQLLLFLDATIALQEGDDYGKIETLLDKALRITKPHLELMDFRHELLSSREANILVTMMAVLYKEGRLPSAIRLGEELFDALERLKAGSSDYQIVKINLAFNLARCMESERRYEEMRAYVRRAEELSRSSAEQLLLPEVLFLKAKACFYGGQTGEAAAIVRAVIPYMLLVGKDAFADCVRVWALDNLGPNALPAVG